MKLLLFSLIQTYISFVLIPAVSTCLNEDRKKTHPQRFSQVVRLLPENDIAMRRKRKRASRERERERERERGARNKMVLSAKELSSWTHCENLIKVTRSSQRNIIALRHSLPLCL